LNIIVATSLHPHALARDSGPQPRRGTDEYYTASLYLQVKNFSIEYDQIFETKKFRTVHSHVYGTVVITCKIQYGRP
jgi:hypothetical protein